MKLNEKKPSEEEKKLREEVKFLNEQVIGLSQKLKEAENYKSHFLSNVRNEIMDPFSSIVTLSRAILEIRNNDVERVRKVMSLIYQDTFSLDLHLKNIFYAAEIESGELQASFAQLETESLLTEISSSLKPFLAKKQVRLIYPRNITGTFHGDGEKIQLIILNLTYALLKASLQKDSLLLSIYLQENLLNFKVFNLRRLSHQSTPAPVAFKEFQTNFKSIEGIHLSVAESLVFFFNGKLEVGIQEGEQVAFQLQIPTSAGEGEDVFSDQSIFFG